MYTALECLIPGDNGVHYRGTQNITSDGTPCIQWSLITKGGRYVTPIDGGLHNYCRRNPGDSKNATWCFIDNGSEQRTCSISMCCKFFCYLCKCNLRIFGMIYLYGRYCSLIVYLSFVFKS